MPFLRVVSWLIVTFSLCLAALPLPNEAAPDSGKSSRSIPAPSKTQTPSPAPSKSSTPSPEPEHIPFALANNEKALFIFAVGQDGDLDGKLTAALSDALPDYFPDNIRIVAEPEWTEKDFISQCKTAGPDMIKGAIFAEVAGVSTDRYASFFFKRDYVDVAGTAFYASCESAPADFAEAAAPKRDKGSPFVRWVSRTEPASYSSTTPNYLPTITSLVGLATAYSIFFPSRSISTVSTRTFPLPTPLPATGAVSSIATTQTTTANPAGSSNTISTISNALVTGYIVAAPNATPAPTSAAPGLTWDAIDSLADKLIIATGCKQLHSTNPKIDSQIQRLRDQVTQTGPPLPLCAPSPPSSP